MHEDFVTSMATMFTWAGLEESESSQAWERISTIMSIPLATLMRVKDIVRKEVPGVDDVQSTISKSVASAR